MVGSVLVNQMKFQEELAIHPRYIVLQTTKISPRVASETGHLILQQNNIPDSPSLVQPLNNVIK